MDLSQNIKNLDLLNNKKFANIARKINTNESSVQNIHSNEAKMSKSAINLGSHAKFFKISRPGKN